MARHPNAKPVRMHRRRTVGTCEHCGNQPKMCLCELRTTPLDQYESLASTRLPDRLTSQEAADLLGGDY